jgi:hypothetical protein
MRRISKIFLDIDFQKVSPNGTRIGGRTLTPEGTKF